MRIDDDQNTGLVDPQFTRGELRAEEMRGILTSFDGFEKSFERSTTARKPPFTYAAQHTAHLLQQALPSAQVPRVQ